MVSADKKAGTDKAPAKKRTVLSPAEKIAKLEADLKKARESAHDKDRKVISNSNEEKAKLVAKRDELTKKIDALDAKIAEAQSNIDGPVTDGVGEAPAS